MELNIYPNEKTYTKGLGLSIERSVQILESSKDWLKNAMHKEEEERTEGVDELDFVKQCAALSENLEEYTFLMINKRDIIERAQKEIYEETCPSCKARKEARERVESRAGRFGGFGFSGLMSASMPGVTEIAPGVFMLTLGR